MSFKSLFVKYHLLNWTRTKMKKQKSSLIIAKPKVNIHGKIQSLVLLRSDFFCSYSFPGPSYSLVHPGLALIFIFGLSPRPLRTTTEISPLLWFSVVANSKICRGRSRNSSATSFRSCHFFSSTSDKPNSQTKYIALLTSLRKGTLSYRHA